MGRRPARAVCSAWRPGGGGNSKVASQRCVDGNCHRGDAEGDAPPEPGERDRDEQQRAEQVTDATEDERAGELRGGFLTGDVDECDIGRVAHRARRATERERRHHHDAPTRGERVRGERSREPEGAGGGDDPSAAVVGEDGEDVPDDRARCGGDEDDARLGVREAEIGTEGLERAVGKPARELVHEADGEQREDEERAARARNDRRRVGRGQ